MNKKAWFWKGRKVMWLVTAGLVAGFAIAAVVYYSVLKPERITIIAKEVVADANGYPLGKFYIGPTAEDLPTVRSEGTGGACLLADLNFLGYPGRDGTPGVDQCDISPDCQNALPEDKRTGVADGGKGWESRCIEKTCWTRPGGQHAFCQLSKDDNGGKPWPTGDYPVPVRDFGDATKDNIDDIYSLAGPGTEIRWRVTGCLSSYNVFSRKDFTPCPKDPYHLEDDGQPKGLTVP